MCLDSDAIARMEAKEESPDFDAPEHHEFCPVNWKNNPWRSTICKCSELRKADRDAAAEEKWDRSQDK